MSSRSSSHQSLKDLGWGMGWGLFLGIVYLLMAGVVITLKGGVPDSKTEGVGLGAVLLMYPASGLVGGAMVGFLRPAIRSRFRATLVGMLALFPASAAFALIYAGVPANWRGHEWFAIVFTAAFIGGLGGYKFWEWSKFDPLMHLRMVEHDETSAHPPRTRKRKK